MNRSNSYPNFSSLLRRRPQAFADIRGSSGYPEIMGMTRFYQSDMGIIVVTEVMGLPSSNDPCKSSVFAFHIHEGDECRGNAEDPFALTRGHYNPHSCPHPYHAGDMPPLFSADGYAFSVFLTDRFSVREIIGRSVVIHRSPDDFHTQPSGAAGEKIACGVIVTR